MRKIQYGLPDGPPDDSEVVLGGCCIEENDPEDVCITCGWRGTLNPDHSAEIGLGIEPT
jgi:hypothetical protein